MGQFFSYEQMFGNKARFGLTNEQLFGNKSRFGLTNEQMFGNKKRFYVKPERKVVIMDEHSSPWVAVSKIKDALKCLSRY